MPAGSIERMTSSEWRSTPTTRGAGRQPDVSSQLPRRCVSGVISRRRRTRTRPHTCLLLQHRIERRLGSSRQRESRHGADSAASEKCPVSSLSVSPLGLLIRVAVGCCLSAVNSSASPTSRIATISWIVPGSWGSDTVSMPAPMMVPRLSCTSTYRHGIIQSMFRSATVPKLKHQGVYCLGRPLVIICSRCDSITSASRLSAGRLASTTATSRRAWSKTMSAACMSQKIADSRRRLCPSGPRLGPA